MNAPEKNVVRLALCLLVIGIVVRILPWGLPSIEHFEVGESFIVANDAPLAVVRDSATIADTILSKTDNEFKNGPKKERKTERPKICKKCPESARKNWKSYFLG